MKTCETLHGLRCERTIACASPPITHRLGTRCSSTAREGNKRVQSAAIRCNQELSIAIIANLGRSRPISFMVVLDESASPPLPLQMAAYECMLMASLIRSSRGIDPCDDAHSNGGSGWISTPDPPIQSARCAHLQGHAREG